MIVAAAIIYDGGIKAWRWEVTAVLGSNIRVRFSGETLTRRYARDCVKLHKKWCIDKRSRPWL